MITPDEIKKKALRKYPSYLISLVSGTNIFPLSLPSNKTISQDFKQLHSELSQLIDHSKETIKYGYTVSYQKIATRKHGVQQLPSEIFFETEHDYLRFTGKTKEAAQFKQDL